MLVLKRNVRETVVLYAADSRIVITLTEAKDGVAKIGIEAPRERVLVLRGELDTQEAA